MIWFDFVVWATFEVSGSLGYVSRRIYVLAKWCQRQSCSVKNFEQLSPERDSNWRSWGKKIGSVTLKVLWKVPIITNSFFLTSGLPQNYAERVAGKVLCLLFLEIIFVKQSLPIIKCAKHTYRTTMGNCSLLFGQNTYLNYCCIFFAGAVYCKSVPYCDDYVYFNAKTEPTVFFNGL